ncbi:MAG: DEAD/DEAH box helicase [Magnetococcus sp. DMHC-6]
MRSEVFVSRPSSERKCVSDFSSLNLLSPIQNSLRKAQHTQPTPIQAEAIPHLLLGRDLLGIAQTGTGKTAAFALPILDRLARNRRKLVPKSARVLILTPTRELASQIVASINTYSQNLSLYCTVIYGGVSQNPQVRAMSRGVDILVATPGRLLDLMGQGHVRLNQLETFVLDEADRMLDMGFIVDIRRIIDHLPPERQTMLFSATMPTEIASLAATLLRDPVRVEVTPSASTVELIDQRVLFVEKGDKRHLLKTLLMNESILRALVFTRTKRGADRVTQHLEENAINASAIHGDKSQSARERALEEFRRGRVRVLVATDIAARGLDVSGISHVINFDMPSEPESYVHRIGRTGRAGCAGNAISFCDSEERGMLRDIERIIRQEVPVDLDHPYHSDLIMKPLPVYRRKQTFSPAPLRGGPQNRNGRGQNAPRSIVNGQSAATSAPRPGGGVEVLSGENRPRSSAPKNIGRVHRLDTPAPTARSGIGARAGGGAVRAGFSRRRKASTAV